MRTGLIARKLGMTRMFTEDGTHVPVTVLKVDHCQVVSQRTAETDGYTALQLGAGRAKVNRVIRAQRGQFAKAKGEPKGKIPDFRVCEAALVDVAADGSREHRGAAARACVRQGQRASAHAGRSGSGGRGAGRYGVR